MTRTMICLLSAQRMQNLIPFFQTGLRCDRAIFIASAIDGRINPRFAAIFDDMAAALHGRVACRLWPEAVEPVHPPQAARVLAQAAGQARSDGPVMINYTGGTKPMSIGAYLAGQENQLDLIYVDTETEQIVHTRGGETSVCPFDLEPISVRQVLNVHGRQVDENWTASHAPHAFSAHLAQEILLRRPGSFEPVLAVQQAVSESQKKAPTGKREHIAAEQLYGPDWLLQPLRDSGSLISEDGTACLTHEAVRFLAGGWLEGYVYYALARHGRRMDVIQSLQVAGVENELDVVCSYNGKLGIVECKSGDLVGKTQPVLNRLRALKESLGGTFAKTFLVTSQPLARMSQVFLRRAREYVAGAVGLEDLVRVEEVIFALMSQKSR